MTDPEKAFNAARTRALQGRARLLKSTREEILTLLREAQREVLADLAEAGDDAARWRLEQLSREITRQLVAFGDKAAARAAGAAGQAWAGGQALVEASLAAGGIRVVGALPLLSTGQLAAIRTFMVDRIKDIGVQAASKIKAEIGLVMMGASTPGEATTKVRDILGEPSRARARTIVQDNLQRAFAVAAHESLLQSAAVVPGLQKQWRRSGKIHPRLHHDLADGQIREVNKPFQLRPLGKPLVEIMFPHDPKAPIGETINCGCVALPFKADWKVAHPGRDPTPNIRDLDPAPPIRELLDKLPPNVPA